MKIKASINYSIDTKSDFIYNLVKEHIYKVNRKAGIERGQSLFGEYITENDFLIPDNYIITRKDIEGATKLSLDKRSSVIEIMAEVIGNTDKEYIGVCKDKLKDKHIDSIYYYMCVINSVAYDKSGNLIDSRVKQIVTEYEYKGIHTMKERYEAAIKLVVAPEPNNIYNIFKIFNDSNGGYKAFTNIIAELVYLENIPPYIYDAFKDTIENQAFATSLLHITTSIITSNTPEEFALKTIVNNGKL